MRWEDGHKWRLANYLEGVALADLKNSPSSGISLEADKDKKMNVSRLPVI
jgi:hypothetical protein